MKNRNLIVYWCLFLLLSVTTVTAQQKDHLKFMGIPISGNVNDFVEKLKSKGFTPPPIDVSNEGLIMLGGKFTNRDVAVVLVPNTSNNNIYRIGVLFEQQSDWGNLESHYNYLLDAFTAKYGKRKDIVRKIESTFYKGNYIFFGLHKGEIAYSDIWELPVGSIQMEIVSVSIKEALVSIIYEDKLGSKVLESNILDDI